MSVVTEPNWATIPAEDKVRIIEAMGFTPVGDEHQPDCWQNLDPGNRCNCVPDPTCWSPPRDVQVFRHETWDERLARSRRRSAAQER